MVTRVENEVEWGGCSGGGPTSMLVNSRGSLISNPDFKFIHPYNSVHQKMEIGGYQIL